MDSAREVELLRALAKIEVGRDGLSSQTTEAFTRKLGSRAEEINRTLKPAIPVITSELYELYSNLLDELSEVHKKKAHERRKTACIPGSAFGFTEQ